MMVRPMGLSGRLVRLTDLQKYEIDVTTVFESLRVSTYEGGRGKEPRLTALGEKLARLHGLHDGQGLHPGRRLHDQW
jgi:hypothetical protein